MTAVAIVSGGSRGLGRSTVEALANEGYAVATFSRSSSEFIEERRRADPDARQFLWEQVDGSDPAALRSFVKGVTKRFGRIDVLVNNAAIAMEGVLALAHEADVHKTIAVNLEGTIHLAQACSRVMLGQRSGVIINVSSIVGMRGYAGLAVYSATKGAMDAFTRSMARELGPRGIRVNSVAPGYLETELSSSLDHDQKQQIVRRTPLGRLGSLEDVSSAITFLVSPAAKFITGVTLVVDGGITC
jgi:3-oxoacyl-[acyl-carrier protein] reductase